MQEFLLTQGDTKLVIELEAREIMYLVASVRSSAPLSRLNRLTYDLNIWYVY